MTEYQPYGVRHFLRDADPEGASELRRRRVPLLGGGEPARRATRADTDELDPRGLFVYRTLVLRRSPAQSRPPAAYGLTRRGDYYEVWQRPAGLAAAVDGSPLGAEHASRRAIPSCDAVSALAARARPGQDLVAARAPARRSSSRWRARATRAAWSTPAHRGSPGAGGARGRSTPRSRSPRAGDYEVWLGGSVRPRVELAIDGRAGRGGPPPASEPGPVHAARRRRARGRRAPDRDPVRRRPTCTRAAAAARPRSARSRSRAPRPPTRSWSGSPPATRAAALRARAWDWIELAGLTHGSDLRLARTGRAPVAEPRLGGDGARATEAVPGSASGWRSAWSSPTPRSSSWRCPTSTASSTSRWPRSPGC